ncbi:MAG: cytochrome P450 [Jatrophihabitantaceae bacterium]
MSEVLSSEPAAVEPQSRYIVNPYPALARLRQNAPVSLIHSAEGLPIWIVTGYEAARAALGDPRIRQGVLQAQALADEQVDEIHLGADVVHMLNSDPPDHTRLRQLIQSAFTPRRVLAMRPVIEQITDSLLDGISGAETADLIPTFAFPLPMLVIGRLLGLPVEDAALFRRWSTGILTIGEQSASEDAAREMTSYLRDFLARKRGSADDDLLMELLRMQAEGQLSEDEIVAMAFLLVIGGHETTVNLLGTSLLALLRNPDQLAWLRENLDRMPAVMEEFLRRDAPVSMATLRFTTEPITLGGQELAAGSFLLISLGGANRDPARFDDPDELRLQRNDRGHLAFGHGIHRCLGAMLGKLEGEIALSRLLTRFPQLSLAVDELDLRWRNTTMLRGVETLPVHLH